MDYKKILLMDFQYFYMTIITTYKKPAVQFLNIIAKLKPIFYPYKINEKLKKKHKKLYMPYK